jgi:hypothetical protein
MELMKNLVISRTTSCLRFSEYMLSLTQFNGRAEQVKPYLNESNPSDRSTRSVFSFDSQLHSPLSTFSPRGNLIVSHVLITSTLCWWCLGIFMRGLIGQNCLRRLRLFEAIFSYNFVLGRIGPLLYADIKYTYLALDSFMAFPINPFTAGCNSPTKLYPTLWLSRCMTVSGDYF